MSPVLAAWSVMIGACLAIALVSLLVWARGSGRAQSGFLLFGIAATAVAIFGCIELRLMSMSTVAEALALHRLGHPVVFVLVVAMLLLAHVHLGTGRRWLLFAAIGARTVVLVANFATEGSVHYLTIRSLRTVSFLGEAIANVDEVVLNPLAVTMPIASLLFVAYVLDASVTLWRSGDITLRRRAVIVGGGMVFAVVAASSVLTLKHYAALDWPYVVTPAFMFVLAAIGYELASEILKAAEISACLAASRKALAIAEHRLRLSTEAAGVAVWEWKPGSDEVHISPPGLAILGLPPLAPVMTEDFLARIHPDDRGPVSAEIERVNADGGRLFVQFRTTRAPGVLRWVALRGGVSSNGHDESPMLRGVMTDVTERIEADARLSVIANASPIGIVMVNRQGRIVFANRQMEAIFGYAKEALHGESIDRLLPDRMRAGHAEYLAAFFKAPVSRAMGEGRYVTGVSEDGRELTLEVSLVPVRVNDEDVVVASVLDQSWRREAEHELARRRDELAHLSRVNLLGELSGSIAHELNQPLTAILSNAQASQQLAAQDRLSPQLRDEILEAIVSDTRRAGEVIRRLRELLRRGELVFERVDLNALILEVLQLMASDLLGRGLNVRTELAPGLPQVLGDRVQLQQVVLNLVRNACDAVAGTVAGAVDRLQILVRTELDPGGLVRASVVDRGAGIPDGALGEVFEPFFTTKPEGLGMGLSVCRTIIERHRGRIGAANNADGGATFHFALSPVAERSS
ncbi:MAG: hypothetical protein RIS35_2250 [Pseudomonadota bacterium]